MTDTKKLIETVDFFLEICQDAGGYKDCRHCCEDNMKNCEHSENADLIKLRLQPPSEELVGDIVEMVLVHVYMENDRFRVDPDVKPIIRKLLGEK